MKDFFNSSWTITVIGGILVGLVLHYILGIVKSKKYDKNTKKAGVIDEGIDSTYINSEGVGPDAGLISRGKGLKSINSKWISNDKNSNQ